MMKKSWGWTVMIALVLCLSVTFLTGCAKKSSLKDTEAVSPESRPAVKMSPTPSKGGGDAAARERARRDQSLREQSLREQVLRAQPAGEAGAKGAAGITEKEATAREAAILKELQIPDINFEYDKYNLTPLAQSVLKAASPAFLKYPAYTLVVEGHCDERGTVEYNLALGEKRAEEAAKFLIEMGIGKDRIKTISYGSEMPLDKGHNEAAWEKNRRVRFVVFPPAK